MDISGRPPIRLKETNNSEMESMVKNFEDSQNNTHPSFSSESEYGGETNDSEFEQKRQYLLVSSYFKNKKIHLWFLVPLTIAVLVYCFYPRAKATEITTPSCSFQKLQKTYPEQDLAVWKYLEVGIEHILNKRVKKPAVYLFSHKGGEHVEKLIRDVAAHSSFCFDNSIDFLELKESDFFSADNDYGIAIQKFKEKIQKGNVILIANLNEIPVKAARALHTICDTESPISSDVVIFLTITVPDIKGNIEEITEDTLHKLWGEQMKNNELDALITRVTDQVIALKS